MSKRKTDFEAYDNVHCSRRARNDSKEKKRLHRIEIEEAKKAFLKSGGKIETVVVNSDYVPYFNRPKTMRGIIAIQTKARAKLNAESA